MTRSGDRSGRTARRHGNGVLRALALGGAGLLVGGLAGYLLRGEKEVLVAQPAAGPAAGVRQGGTTTEPPPHRHHLTGAGYERRDLPARWVITFGIGLLAALAMVIGGATFLQLGHIGHWPGIRSPADVILGKGEPPVSGNPLLESGQSGAAASQAAAEQWLHSYGWRDQGRGIVHIPIDRAMDLIAQRGLPVQPSPQPAGGAGMAADSASGRPVPRQWP